MTKKESFFPLARSALHSMLCKSLSRLQQIIPQHRVPCNQRDIKFAGYLYSFSY